jgi:hypothetical protein
VEAWSGTRIGDYIRAETGDVVLQCGATEVPLS